MYVVCAVKAALVVLKSDVVGFTAVMLLQLHTYGTLVIPVYIFVVGNTVCVYNSTTRRSGSNFNALDGCNTWYCLLDNCHCYLLI